MTAEVDAPNRRPTRTGPRRVAEGVRLMVLTGALLAVVGIIGHGPDWVMLSTAVGPTAYILLAHPTTAPGRMRSAVIGHGCAIACSLALLAAFGLWDAPSVAQTGTDTGRQIAAQALAVGLTALLLTLFNAHHAPAAATALLITSGIAHPGPPLYGLVTGLALTIVGGLLLTRLPAPAGRLPGGGDG